MKSMLKRRERVMGTRKHTAFNIPGHNPPTPAISTNSPKAYREETPHKPHRQGQQVLLIPPLAFLPLVSKGVLFLQGDPKG